MDITRIRRISKTFPDDWGQPIRFHGYSRNLASKAWMVRMTVNGKQEFIGFADTQEGAAKLYDLALWRLAPKLKRQIRPNFPEDFTFINSDMVTRTCPRLDEIFELMPWVDAGDENKCQENLRAAILAGSRGDALISTPSVAAFDRQLVRVKRLRDSLNTSATDFELLHLSMPGFHKLAEAPALWRDVEASLRQSAIKAQALITSMELQREYFAGLGGDTLPE